MRCSHFGRCGSCSEFEGGYESQLKRKIETQTKAFNTLYDSTIDVIKSADANYRNRAEFRIWHIKDKIHLAMNSKNRDKIVLLDECPMLLEPMEKLAFKIIGMLDCKTLKHKLFGIEFLSNSSGNDMLVTLLYHRQLDEQWQQEATKLALELGVNIIGRARKLKLVLGRDHIMETLSINSKEYRYKQLEGSFTQPNASLNAKMIEWSLDAFKEIDGDLLELYCGAGNFTIPFASSFRQILATEISKSSIATAKENMLLNSVDNIEFVRLSAEELVEALDKKREFRRLKDIDLASYNFKALFVDPPRAGLDTNSRSFASRFETILYISCNPTTLLRDLEVLHSTHRVEKMALFDQFAYTPHIEMGVKLTKR